MTKWLIVAPIHRPECNPLHGCTCGKTEAYDQTIAAMALLADFDRGEQG